MTGADGRSRANVRTLASRYVTLIARSYPGRALRWDVDVPDEDYVDSCPDTTLIWELRALETACGAIRETDVELEMLRRSIRERLFELEDLGEWRQSPSFYVEKRCEGVLAHLLLQTDWPPARTAQRALIGLVKSIPAVVASAGHNLVLEGVPRFDALHAGHALRRFRSFLEHQLLPTGAVPAPILEAAVSACHRLEGSLAEVPEQNPLTRPLGAAMLRTWFDVTSGIDINVDHLAETCFEVLAETRDALQQEFAGRPPPLAGQLRPDPLWVFAACEDAYECLRPWFGEKPAIFNELVIRQSNGNLANFVSRATYVSVGYLNGRPIQRLIYDPAAYAQELELRIDLAHEVYPGHHWERQSYYACHQGQLGCLTYESAPYLEGWPKYCEEFYGRLLGSPPALVRAKAGIGKMALQTAAVLAVHAFSRSFSSARDDLVAQTGLPASMILSLLMSAYVTPWALAAPFVGYLALKQVLSGADDVVGAHQRILALGPRILWGVRI